MLGCVVEVVVSVNPHKRESTFWASGRMHCLPKPVDALLPRPKLIQVKVKLSCVILNVLRTPEVLILDQWSYCCMAS